MNRLPNQHLQMLDEKQSMKRFRESLLESKPHMADSEINRYAKHYFNFIAGTGRWISAIHQCKAFIELKLSSSSLMKELCMLIDDVREGLHNAQVPLSGNKLIA